MPKTKDRELKTLVNDPRFQAGLGQAVAELVQDLRQKTPEQREAWLREAFARIATRGSDPITQDGARAMALFAVALVPVLDRTIDRSLQLQALDAELDRLLVS